LQTNQSSPAPRWYSGVSRYQWLILAVASAGWIFDAFEGQIYVITHNALLADILHADSKDSAIKKYTDFLQFFFLFGGAFGGMLFGSLADKWGRRPTLVITILLYSIFSGLTYFAATLWQVAALRFLVALGVGGEWAVAASLVAEVFPKHARAHASGIFHATSVLGTWIASLAGLAVGLHWRYAYLISLLPALLVVWVLASVKEPESWKSAEKASEAQGPKMGSFRDLLGNPRWRARALLGMLLAAIGLGSFWGVTVAGLDLAREFLLRHGAGAADAAKGANIAYGWIETAGGGLGLLAFGPLAVRLGRRGAFALMHIMAFIMVPITCYLPQEYWQLLCILPVFGFFTLGIHAGYAIYFPELFPNHLRATGTGFCFNGGRVLAATILVLSGHLKNLVPLPLAMTILGCLFPLGLIVIFFLPETKGQPLPE